jgi:hypothetical protein
MSDIVVDLREFSNHIHDDLEAKLVQDAADEIEILRESNDDLDERCTKLRELIAAWVDASEKWNMAMWQKDLTDSERSVIVESLVHSIRRLKAESAR